MTAFKAPPTLKMMVGAAGVVLGDVVRAVGLEPTLLAEPDFEFG